MSAPGAATLAAVALAAIADTPPLVNVCWDYGCDRSERLVLPASDWRAIRALFEPAPRGPGAERKRIAAAIARFEAAVGARTGTDRDRRGNFAGAGEPGQLDCIDESRNTTGYLRILADRDLLRWHGVGERRRRAKWIFDVHWTAVLVEHGSGRRWAVDSWYLGNGERPYIQRLPAWHDKAELPPNPDAP